MHEVRRGLGFEACFVVDRQGRNGSLALLWRKDNICEVQNYSQNFINVIIKEDSKQA